MDLTLAARRSPCKPAAGRRALLLLAATLAAVLATPSTPADPTAPPTLASFHRGEELVRLSLAALGEPGAVAAEGGLLVRGEGRRDLTVRLQGSRADEPQPVTLTESVAVLPAAAGEGGGSGEAHRVAYEVHGRVNADADEHVRYVYDAPGSMLVVLPSRRQVFRAPAEGGARRYARRVPHLLLAEAWEQRHTLRHLGSFAGEEAVAVTLAGDGDGRPGPVLTLYFAAGEPPRLTGFAYLLDMPVNGDTTVRWRFGDYRPVDGIGAYPAGHRLEVGGRLLEEVAYTEVVAGGTAGADGGSGAGGSTGGGFRGGGDATSGAAVLFAPPEGMTFPPPPAAAEDPAGGEPPSEEAAPVAADAPDLPEVRTVAPGVHLALSVRGGFHALFVELGDSVVVVDAPAGYHELSMVPAIDWAGDVTASSVGRRLLAAVRATIPGKPVSHLVLTHHHGDHAGGLRPFLAAGATVVTAAATRGVVEQAASAVHRLEPDEWSRLHEDGAAAPPAPRIQVVDGSLTLEGGGRELRILDVGPNPHAEGMLVVHLPAEEILYQADLFFPSGSHFPDPDRLPVMRWFVEWLRDSGLEVETVYSIHGSARVTDEQLDAVLDRSDARAGDAE